MDVITRILNMASLLAVAKCTIELIKFLMWDEWYFYRLSSNDTISWPESLLEDIFYDLGLLLLFVGLHRLMSYTRYKNKVDLMPVSGPVYVIISSLTLLILMKSLYNGHAVQEIPA
ncbi:uncharacterized protein LOC125648237 [Ostrea edulis]|uniref:uncharacterized protein LOC125648237 n=1 Tax=Ostrea edulis TaxID=37623 RepID=UPI0024AF2CB8|nr:uncharacterized protein LOC125648237 [Ostrea edulis]